MMRNAMTSLVDVLTTDGEATVDSRARFWPRLLAGFALGFVLCLGIVVGALLAYDFSHDGRVLRGVGIGGVDLSGLDHNEASAALESAFGGYAEGRVVIRTPGGNVSVRYDEFSRHADIEAMVDAAMRTGRSGNPAERALTEVRLALNGVSLEPRVALDEAALAARVRAAVARLDRVPVDSRVSIGARSIDTTPARAGRRLDGAAAAAAALEIVRRTDAPAEVSVEAAATVIPAQHADSEALAAKAAAERMIGEVVLTLDKQRWKIDAATVRGWLRFDTGADGSAWPIADQKAITQSLTKIAKAVRRAPASATLLKTRGGRIVGVAAARDGRQLNAAGTATAIAGALASRGGGAAAVPIAVRMAKIPPKFSTAEALKRAPLMARLGSWKTWFPIGERNYWGANIWLPAKIIDGTVLEPGQTFDWWRALGPVTPARGFGPGGFIAGDHTDPTGALGGGMCSSSTTLFNAALRAGLQMGARSNHRYYINRYPLGLDATVSKTRTGSQTITFTNDMDHPIVIRTFRYRSGGRGWVRYEIWGIPDGRSVSLSKPAVTNLRKATTRTVYVSTLRAGVRKQTEYPSNGMNVSVTRVVRDRNGRILHREVYGSHSALWDGRIEIGR